MVTRMLPIGLFMVDIIILAVFVYLVFNGGILFGNFLRWIDDES